MHRRDRRRAGFETQRTSALFALACIVWANGCGGDGGTEPTRPPETPRPARVTVSPAAIELTALGATEQLSAEVRDQNGNVMAGAAATWASGDASVATVDRSGLVTAVANGTATITATLGSVSGSATAAVAQQVSSVEVTPATGFVLPGTTLRLMAEATDANAHVVDGAEFAWASSDTTVAVVDATGLVTGTTEGDVEVSATSSGVTGRAQLDVVKPEPQAVVVAPDAVVLEALGDTLRLAAEVQDQVGRPMPGAAVTWTASDTLVASVDSTGLLTAVANGQATITAASGPISGDAAVEVMQVARTVLLAPPADTLVLGDSVGLVAEAFDARGHPVDGAAFAWSSSDPSIAAVDASGVVRGVGEGAAEITVAAGGVRQASRIWVFSPDRASLVALYEAANGDGWTNGRDWASDRPLSEWFGVEADADGRVTRLVLGDNGLEGRIPPEIGDLSRLTDLQLNQDALTGPIPPEIGKLAELRILSLWGNDLTGPIPPEIGALSNLSVLWLGANSLTGPIPSELGGLAELRRLGLQVNALTGSIPAELSRLSNLEGLHLYGNRLTGPIPSELSRLSNLEQLTLYANHLTGPIPSELGNLSNLEALWLSHNRLTGPIPSRLGDLSSLRDLRLLSNDLTGTIPARLGDLEGLVQLELQDNDLEGRIPEELGRLRSLERLLLHQNDLTGPIPAALGEVASLRLLYLAHNDLSGPVPAEFSALAALEELRLNGNSGLSGFLPGGLANLGKLTTLLADGTSLCAPAEADFLVWLGTLESQRVARCRNDLPAAYLVQAVQSLDYPVPLVANRRALLRVFLTAPDGESVDFPPVRARFYLDGEEVHTVDIPGPGGTVPAEVGEGSLDASANADIPADVLRPGLELVVEVDPDRTLGAEVGLAKRIPESGRQAIDVRTVPPLHLTYLPVLRPGRPEPAFLERVAQFTADHSMFRPTRLWLPVDEFTLDVRETYFTSAASGSELLREIEAIRVLEGGAGHYMGGVPAPLALEWSFGGLAIRPGRTSWSYLDPSTVAHELGHNMILEHAPCGGISSPDPDFPDRAGRIGAWGFDASINALVSPETADLMGACYPDWIGTFSFGTAFDYRLEEEAAAAAAAGHAERTLLVWGGVDAAGAPFLNPAFVVDAPPTLPRSAGPYTLTGRTAAGEELFLIEFDTQQVADGDGGSTFVFALPVSPGWADRLAAIEVSAPEGVATLDRTEGPSMALLRDPRTGRVRAILRDLAGGGDRLGSLAGVAAEPGAIVSALGDAADLEVLISSGLPPAIQWRR
ncbi:Ig-like domain-containing protein [Candidatus Palauibacter sp.]|uniref:Ig-like domain-containing protein n=1 Tax=Candidatus Palauibacter sp. TaxID=3101350 RepID=UPI003D0BB737